jgi:hypothetical protein
MKMKKIISKSLKKPELFARRNLSKSKVIRALIGPK